MKEKEKLVTNVSIKKATLEKALNLKLKSNCSCLGVDTASRTGWARVIVNTTTVKIECGVLAIDTKNTYFKYNEIIDIFKGLIVAKEKVIVEDTFFSFNPSTFRLISRLGAIVYTLAHLAGCPTTYLLASSARKGMGFKGNMKKADFQKEFLNKSKITLDDACRAWRGRRT